MAHMFGHFMPGSSEGGMTIVMRLRVLCLTSQAIRTNSRSSGFRVSGFRVLGSWGLAFRVFGFRVLRFRVYRGYRGMRE